MFLIQLYEIRFRERPYIVFSRETNIFNIRRRDFYRTNVFRIRLLTINIFKNYNNTGIFKSIQKLPTVLNGRITGYNIKDGRFVKTRNLEKKLILKFNYSRVTGKEEFNSEPLKYSTGSRIV